MPTTQVRQISRAKLFEVFKTAELVDLFETLLSTVNTFTPESSETVQQNLDDHIDDATGAHQASSIGVTPSGGITVADVQSALVELDTNKLPAGGALAAFAALAFAADQLPYATGASTFALTPITAFMRTLLDDAGANTARTTLGVAIGVDVQGYSLALDAWSLLSTPTGDVVGTSDPQVLTNKTITSGTIGLASGTLGYATGNGGTQTQATSKSTGVTLDKICGDITTNAASLAANTAVSFVLTNSTIAATDRIILNHGSGGTFGAYHLDARAAAGSATIVIRNLTAGALAEAIVIRYLVVKGANA